MTGGDEWDFDRFDRSRVSSSAPSQVPTGGSPVFEPSGGGSDGAFAADLGPAGGALDLGRPPVFWIAVAALTAVLAAILGLVQTLVGPRGLAPFAWVGWLIAGPVAIGFLALFTVRDTAAQTRAVYARPPWVSAAYWGCLGLCIVVVLVNALALANWAGSR